MNINESKAFQNHVFDFVKDNIQQEVSYYKKSEPIKRNSDLDWDLDLQTLGLMFLFQRLENLTFLNLNIDLDSIVTVDDICKLIESRFKSADKQLLLQKISAATVRSKFIPNIRLGNQRS